MARVLIAINYTVCCMLTITHLWLSYNIVAALVHFAPGYMNIWYYSLVKADAQDFINVMSIISSLPYMAASYYIRYTTYRRLPRQMNRKRKVFNKLMQEHSPDDHISRLDDKLPSHANKNNSACALLCCVVQP